MSAKKTLQILNLFDFDMTTLTVPEISEKLEQPQSSIYRYVRLLKNEGFLIEDNGSYKLGYHLLKLARIVKNEDSLASIARPVMKRLTNTTGETSILLVQSDFHAVCIETVPAPHPIKVSSEQGEILPLYAGASSTSLLAYLDEELVDGLFKQINIIKYTENTLTNIYALKNQLKEIHERGYAFSDSEIDNGIVAYGVPLFDMNGDVVASLSIAGPRDRVQKNTKGLVEQIKSAVLEIQKYV